MAIMMGESAMKKCNANRPATKNNPLEKEKWSFKTDDMHNSLLINGRSPGESVLLQVVLLKTGSIVLSLIDCKITFILSNWNVLCLLRISQY